MPTYEYVCEACDHEFEEFQSITAKPLKKCPECAKLKLRRKIGTGAGVIFRGGGFYETDYRSDSYKKAEKAEKDASSGKSEGGKSESKSDASGSTKSDAKPAAKTDSKPAAKKTAAKSE